MTRILACGDPHFKAEYPYGDLIADGRRAERAAVEAAIHKESANCGAVVLMGDNLDKRNNPSTVLKEFVEFIDGFGDKDVYILSGNHETYEGDKTALDFLIGVKPNWHVVTPKSGPTFVPKLNIGLVPYMTNASLRVSTIEEATEKLTRLIEDYKYDALFIHHMISDCVPPGAGGEIVLPRERLEAVSWTVVAGHIHGSMVRGRTFLTGNIFSHEVGDHEKFVWKFDTEDETYEKIPLPVRSIHKIVNPHSQELDFIPTNAIVKVVLTEKGLNVEAIKEKLKTFDAHILVESYPDERKRMHVEKGQVLDLSIDALLDLYAKAKKKDAERLHEALALVKAT